MNKKTAKWVNYSILIFLVVFGGLGFLISFAKLGHYNLIVAAAILSFIAFVVPEEILGLLTKNQAWLKSLTGPRFLFSIGFGIAFCASALMSGTWDPTQKLAYVHFLDLHIHHWLTWLIRGLLFLRIIKGLSAEGERAKEHYFRRRAKLELILAAGLTLFVLLSFLEPLWFRNVTSFRLLFGWLTFISLGLGLLLRSPAISAPGFKSVLATLLGVSVGVASEGLVGLVKDFPTSLDFLN